MNWKKNPEISLPGFLKDKTPIYSVDEAYSLETFSGEELVVSRISTEKGESLRIDYKRKDLEEIMIIFEGKIAKAYTNRLSGEKLDLDDDACELSVEEKLKRLKKYMEEKSQRQDPTTYYNIKKFEHQLKVLPWQEDLQAIYDGNGFFDNQKNENNN